MRNRVVATLAELAAAGNPANVAGMRRYKVCGEDAYGVSMPALRKLGKRLGRDPELAEALWTTGNFEARILATLVHDAGTLPAATAERWARESGTWAFCDACCINLFRHAPYAWELARAWSRRKEEFVKRAGFVLMAVLAVHDRRAEDSAFLRLLPHLRRGATDERQFVKKAVNWALRQIGKRNTALHAEAMACARSIAELDSPAARWIAADALRELQSETVQRRLAARPISRARG